MYQYIFFFFFTKQAVYRYLQLISLLIHIVYLVRTYITNLFHNHFDCDFSIKA